MWNTRSSVADAQGGKKSLGAGVCPVWPGAAQSHLWRTTLTFSAKPQSLISGYIGWRRLRPTPDSDTEMFRGWLSAEILRLFTGRLFFFSFFKKKHDGETGRSALMTVSSHRTLLKHVAENQCGSVRLCVCVSHVNTCGFILLIWILI